MCFILKWSLNYYLGASNNYGEERNSGQEFTLSYLPNDEHEVFFITCMAHSGYGQSACWSDSLTSTHKVWSYPPLPPEKNQRRSWNASVHDATVVTNRQGTGHWHAHCYDTLTWGAKALVDTSFHHSSQQKMPSSTTTKLPNLAT